MEKYKSEIVELIKIGVSVRSAWKIINNNKISEDGKISYNAFLHYINKNIK